MESLLPKPNGKPSRTTKALVATDPVPELLTTEFLIGKKLRIQCTARSKVRLRMGDPDPRCLKNAIPGASVCIYHGGRTPQVKAKAAKRWGLIQHLAQERLLEILIHDEDNLLDPKVVLEIAKTGGNFVELMEGRATSRSETQILERREELVLNLNARMDNLVESEAAKRKLEKDLGIE